MSKPPLIVNLWTWSLDTDPVRQVRLAEYLSPDEHARANAFATERLRGRWIVARAGMRDVLARERGISPDALRFAYGEFGKPSLCDGLDELWFNLSHSDDVAVLGICTAPIGVDVERIGGAHEDVARDYFSEGEAAAVLALPESQRAEAFYRYWTAKEAFLKALGTGFSRSSTSFTLISAPNAPARLVDAPWLDSAIEDWRFAQFEPRLGFRGAVAVLSGGSELRISQHAWCG